MVSSSRLNHVSTFPDPFSIILHQMSPDFSTSTPDPATPICPAITSFPSPELPHPSSHLDLMTLISHSFIRQILCASVSLSMLLLCFLALYFCLRSSVTCMFTWTCTCLPVSFSVNKSLKSSCCLPLSAYNFAKFMFGTNTALSLSFK